MAVAAPGAEGALQAGTVVRTREKNLIQRAENCSVHLVRSDWAQRPGQSSPEQIIHSRRGSLTILTLDF